MANQILIRRGFSIGIPPANLPAGEPYAVLDNSGHVDLYIGDDLNNPVLINPAATPIGGYELQYRWSSDQTVTEPVSGDVKINGAQDGIGPPIADTLSISSFTSVGNDASVLFATMQVGDLIGIFEQGGGGGAGGELFYWEVSAPAVPQGATWWTIAGEAKFWSGDDVDNVRPCSVFYIPAPNNKLPALGDQDDYLAKTSATDFDTDWRKPDWDRWSYPYARNTAQLVRAVVRDGDWLMYANKATSEGAAPVPAGNPVWDMIDNPAWTTPQHNGVVRSGREWETTDTIVIKSYEIWVPTINVDTAYTIITYSHPTGSPENATIKQLANPALQADQWSTIAVGGEIVLAGTTFGILINALNAGSSTLVTGGWSRSANSQDLTTDPAAGGYGTDNADTTLRISFTDLDVTDRETEVMTMVAGTEVSFVSVADANVSITYRINAAPVNQTTHASFDSLEITGTGALGAPAIGAVTTMTATVPVPAGTDYVSLGLGNPTHTWGTSIGVLELDGIPQLSVEPDAFGVRVQADEYVSSADWDVMGYVGLGSGGTGGGGDGGVTLFTQLSDTPIDYVGQANKVASVNVAEDALEFTDLIAPTTTFEGLTDTPNSYVGQEGRLATVNGTASGLEFTDPEPHTALFTALTDTPADYVGAAGQVATVNVGESALEFAVPTPPTTEFTALTDTPASYVGQEGKRATVNGAATGLEFTDQEPASTAGNTPPVSPEEGDLWYSTADPTGLFTWHTDIDSSQWIQVNGGEKGDDGGLTATQVVDVIYPIGSVYISLLATDPAIAWVGTTWVLDSVDEAIVGAGGARIGGETFGADEHSLTEAELASHDHSVDPPSTATNVIGNHTHNIAVSGTTGSNPFSSIGANNTAPSANVNTDGGGSHSHTVDIAAFNSAAAGSGAAHSSVQASRAFYLWRRTA